MRSILRADLDYGGSEGSVGRVGVALTMVRHRPGRWTVMVGVHTDRGATQARDVVEQLVLDLLRDPVALLHGQLGFPPGSPWSHVRTIAGRIVDGRYRSIGGS